MIASESCPPQGPPQWAAPWRRVWRSASRGRFWSLAATTPLSFVPRPHLDLAGRAIAFAAMGTAGQRCTTLRRLIVHEDIYDKLLGRLGPAYASVPVGDPREKGALVGPLIDQRAYRAMRLALDEAGRSGGVITGGERLFMDRFPDAYYVRPALVEIARTGARRVAGNFRANSLCDALPKLR